MVLSACRGSDGSGPASTTSPAAVAIDGSTTVAALAAPVTAMPAAAPTIAARAAAPTAANAPPTSIRPPRGLATPEAASKNLWDAWRDDDRPRALVAATPAAVDALFREPWGAEIRNQGCAALSANTYRCAFVAESTARIVTVVGGPRAGYRSTRVDEVSNAALATLVPVTTVPVVAPDDSVVGEPGSGASVPGTSGPAGTATTTGLDGSPAAIGAAATASEAPTIPTTAKQRAATRSTARRSAKTTKAVRAKTTAQSVEAPATTAAPPAATQPAATEGRVAVNAPVTQVADG